MELYNQLPLEIQYKILDDYKLVYRNGLYLGRLDTTNFENLYKNMPKISFQKFRKYELACINIPVINSNKVLHYSYTYYFEDKIKGNRKYTYYITKDTLVTDGFVSCYWK